MYKPILIITFCLSLVGCSANKGKNLISDQLIMLQLKKPIATRHQYPVIIQQGNLLPAFALANKYIPYCYFQDTAEKSKPITTAIDKGVFKVVGLYEIYPEGKRYLKDSVVEITTILKLESKENSRVGSLLCGVENIKHDRNSNNSRRHR